MARLPRPRLHPGRRRYRFCPIDQTSKWRQAVYRGQDVLAKYARAGRAMIQTEAGTKSVSASEVSFSS